MQLEQVIKRPLLLTEKGNAMRESQNKYQFEVAREANKHEIKDAVETLFNVSVVDVKRSHMNVRLQRYREASPPCRSAFMRDHRAIGMYPTFE